MRTEGLYRALGLDQVRFLNFLATVNSCILTLGILAVLINRILAPSELVKAQFHPWGPERSNLVVVDKTGDPRWQEATRHAVDSWSPAGAGIRLRWATGSGPCRYQAGRIEICEASRAELSDGALRGLQGLADQRLADGRADSAIVQVCGDCTLDARRQRVIASHEIGHTLGLEHSMRLGSVMFHAGGADRPDERDYQALRDRYAEEDR